MKHIFILMTVAVMTLSCNGSGKERPGPEATLEKFCMSLAAGDYDTALALCDTVSMKEYIENYLMAMTHLQKEDSCAATIAISMLSGAEFEVNDTEKNDNERIIRYTLKAEGDSITRKATVRKEEEEWKVTAITDGI